MQYIGVQRSLGPINSIIFCGVSVGPTKLGNKAGEQSWGKNQFGLLASPPLATALSATAGERSWGTKLGNKVGEQINSDPWPAPLATALMFPVYNPPEKSPKITARWSSREAREEPEGRPEKPEDLQILRGDSPQFFSPLPGPVAIPSDSSLASPDSIK